MKAWALERRLAGVQFDFYVLCGDAELPDRMWVCVRTKERPTKWLGCWSRNGPTEIDRLRSFLKDTQEFIESEMTIGPFGPVFRIKFLEEWQTWGMGVPIAIQGFRPWEGLDIPVDTIEAIDLSRGVPIEL